MGDAVISHFERKNEIASSQSLPSGAAKGFP